jgi:vacuolar protein sorting-associated protein 41
VPHVPAKDISLPALVYEMILGYYLDTSSAAFLTAIRTWPPAIYNPDPIISAVQNRWQKFPSDRNLMESLAELYLVVNQPREVVKFYLRLNKPETFEFIRRFRLFDVIKEDVVRFLQLDSEENEKEPNGQGLALLMDHAHTISPELVLEQLTSLPYFQYFYIRALRDREGGFLEEYGDLQVPVSGI